MAFLKVVVFFTLLVAAIAAPGYEDFGHIAPVASISHAPALSFSHAPALSVSHAPALSVAHAPALSVAHAPALSVAHAPVAVAHAPVAVDHHAPANYEFKYGVRDGHTHDIKEQAEKRVGDKVEGYYSLVEPDGTTRTVHYTADHHNGFNAVVQKSGHAAHPATPVAVPVQKAVVAPVHSVVAAAPSYSYAPSYSHAAPVFAHAAPALSFAHAPSYAHAAPAVSYSNALGHAYSGGLGYASLGHGLSLGHGYGGYH